MCAQIIRCLQDHVDEEAFSSECKEEVTRDQIRSNQDYRCALLLCPPGLPHACPRMLRDGPAGAAISICSSCWHLQGMGDFTNGRVLIFAGL